MVVVLYEECRQHNEGPAAGDCHLGAIASKGREARKGKVWLVLGVFRIGLQSSRHCQRCGGL